MAGEAFDWTRQPGRGRYARPERERRFLLRGQPPTGAPSRRIEDRYLTGTTLRLRHVRVGDESVFKLTQKVRLRADDPAEVAVTNTYLSAAEHQRLLVLPAAVVVKTRTLHRVVDHVFAVDDFHGHLAGLRLAEVEVEDLAAPLALPPWAGPEVTHDERFAGGALAVAGPDRVAALLALSRG